VSEPLGGTELERAELGRRQDDRRDLVGVTTT
jgi:hypothetical protein